MPYYYETGYLSINVKVEYLFNADICNKNGGAKY